MKYKIAVVGATGNVGREILKILDEREFPVSEIHAIASDRSVGKSVSFGEDVVLKVEPLSGFDFKGIDFVFSSPGASVSQKFAPKAAESGAYVIDNSSAFRMEPGIPLVVPEVNPEALEKAKKKRIIANPNCVALPLTIALKPLHSLSKIKRLVVSTYQSVSGAGNSAMRELMDQTKASLMNAAPKSEIFQKQIAFNLFPHIGTINADGITSEEEKIMAEVRKILDPDIKICATSVRVPVFIGHAISVAVEFENDVTTQSARNALQNAHGIELIDDRDKEDYITPLETAGTDEVFVSRIRKDPSVKNGLLLWVACDNLRKGAALNTVQIAEKMIEMGMV